MNDMKIKNCPFCGKQPELRIYKYSETENHYSVWCTNCYDNKFIALNTFSYLDKNDAIKIWNKREENKT